MFDGAWQAVVGEDSSYASAKEEVSGQWQGRPCWAFVFDEGSNEGEPAIEAVVMHLDEPWHGMLASPGIRKGRDGLDDYLVTQVTWSANPERVLPATLQRMNDLAAQASQR